jgi:hypothetical protein
MTTVTFVAELSVVARQEPPDVSDDVEVESLDDSDDLEWIVELSEDATIYALETSERVHPVLDDDPYWELGDGD